MLPLPLPAPIHMSVAVFRHLWRLRLIPYVLFPVTITDPSGLVVLVIPGIALGGLLTFLANLLLIAIGVLLA